MILVIQIHQFVPESLERIDLGITTLKKNGFINITTFIYFFTSKLSVLISLIVWFLSCSYWWKYAIISPIALFTYQSWEVWEDLKSFDAHGNLAVISVVLIIILFVLTLSRFANYKAEVLDLYEYLNSEIENHLSKESITSNIVQYKKKYKDLRQVNYEGTMIKDYLSNLNDLKEELNKRLK
ncbi:MAG: hypothetical protein KJO53_01370, partial [Eudoraea sp.]|nr:hypothetical protein [Eudoraea sp.]